MATVNIRKARAGSSSHGYTWPTDGAVVAVSYEDSLELLRIPDGGFSVVADNPTFNEAPPAVEAPRPRGRPRKIESTEITE